ncbi:MAG TPA: RNA polymerase sigma factor [Solirubrobacterales bacterium]
MKRLKLGNPSSRESDSQLVQRAVAHAKQGDPEGLHFLYLRYAPDVQRFVNSVVHDLHEAEDITQNIFAKLIDTIVKYEQRDVPFTAWILRVARNAALDHVRARRAIPTEDVRVADSGQAQISIDRSHALRTALEQLPDDQREVLVLRHIVGLSPVEIADALEKTESSVHGLHHRGRRSLQASLADLGVAPVVASRIA